MKKRDLVFDLLRIVPMTGVLWLHIVADAYHAHDIPAVRGITFGMLGCFTFVSGHFLAKKRFETLSDILSYAKTRIVRIFPLYFFAGVALVLIGFNAWENTIAGFFGVSMFYKTLQVKTLWYMAMLVCFYLITPLLLWRASVANGGGGTLFSRYRSSCFRRRISICVWNDGFKFFLLFSDIRFRNCFGYIFFRSEKTRSFALLCLLGVLDSHRSAVGRELLSRRPELDRGSALVRGFRRWNNDDVAVVSV